MLICFFNEYELVFKEPEFVRAAGKSKTKTTLNLLQGVFSQCAFSCELNISYL